MKFKDFLRTPTELINGLWPVDCGDISRLNYTGRDSSRSSRPVRGEGGGLSGSNAWREIHPWCSRGERWVWQDNEVYHMIDVYQPWYIACGRADIAEQRADIVSDGHYRRKFRGLISVRARLWRQQVSLEFPYVTRQRPTSVIGCCS